MNNIKSRSNFNMGIYLNISDAMSRLNNNKNIFVKFLKKFDGAAMLEDLKNKIEAGDAEAARAQAHTIKGLAANLSLQDLHAKAAALELAIKTAGTTDGINLSEISESTAATDEAVKAWIEANE